MENIADAEIFFSTRFSNCDFSLKRNVTKKIYTALKQYDECESRCQIVKAFSSLTKYQLWKLDPKLPGLELDAILPQLSLLEFSDYIKNEELKDEVTEKFPFDKMNHTDWVSFLYSCGKITSEVIKKRLSPLLSSFSLKEIADIVHLNFCVVPLFSPEKLPTNIMVRYFESNDSEGYFTAEFFNSLSSEVWKEICKESSLPALLRLPFYELAYEKMYALLKGARLELVRNIPCECYLKFESSEILSLLRGTKLGRCESVQKDVKKLLIPRLTQEMKDDLVKSSARFLNLVPPSDISEDLFVELYLKNPKLFSRQDFKSKNLTFLSWTAVLEKCGGNVPSDVNDFLHRQDEETTLSVLDKNPNVVFALDNDIISKLPYETFCGLCEIHSGPKFLLSAYPISSIPHKEQVKLLQSYPWCEELFDWKNWSLSDVAFIASGGLENRSLISKYPHKKKLWFYRHRIGMSFTAICLGIMTVGFLIFSHKMIQQGFELAQYKHATEEALTRRAEANAAMQKRELEVESKRIEEKKLASRLAEMKLSVKLKEEERLLAEAKTNELEIARLIAETNAPIKKLELEVESKRIEEYILTSHLEAQKLEIKLKEEERLLAEAKTNELEIVRLIAETNAPIKKLELEALCKKADAEKELAISKIKEAQAKEAQALADKEAAAAKRKEEERCLAELAAKDEEEKITIKIDEHKKTIAGRINNIGLKAFEDKYFACSFRLFEYASELGSATATFNLGLMYERGLGVKKSLEKAIKWYKKAANEGEKRAKDKLKKLGVDKEEPSKKEKSSWLDLF